MAPGLVVCGVAAFAEMTGGSGEKGWLVLVLGLAGQFLTAAGAAAGRARKLAWAVFGYGVAALFTSFLALVVVAGWLSDHFSSCTDFCGLGTMFFGGVFGAVGIVAVVLGGCGVLVHLEQRRRRRVFGLTAAVMLLGGVLAGAAYAASSDQEVRSAAERFQPPPPFRDGRQHVQGNWACWLEGCTESLGFYEGPDMHASSAKRVAGEHMTRRLKLAPVPIAGAGRDGWRCQEFDPEFDPGELSCSAVFSDGRVYYRAGLDWPEAGMTSLSVGISGDEGE